MDQDQRNNPVVHPEHEPEEVKMRIELFDHFVN